MNGLMFNFSAKKMEIKDIIDRAVHLLEPDLQDTINKLRIEEKEYFIHHLTLDLQRSLEHWKFKSSL